MGIWRMFSEGIMGKPAKIYSEKIADQLGAKLDHLAQNPKGLQVRDIVFRLRPKIEAAQAAGHSLEDIAEAFKTEGIAVTLNTLKRYLQESRAQLNTNGKVQDSPEITDLKPSKVGKTKSKETKVKAETQDLSSTDHNFQKVFSDDDL